MNFGRASIRKSSEISKGSDSSNSDSEDGHCMEDNESGHHSDLKRPRLTTEQVKLLEKSFGEENKLEPERKKRLSTELGLHPRQIAVWFQNRRVRWKTKQLEKDYDTLRLEFEKKSAEFKVISTDYDLLKRDYEDLISENARLCARMTELVKRLGTTEPRPDLMESFLEGKAIGVDPGAKAVNALERRASKISALAGLDRANSCNSENSDVVDVVTTDGSRPKEMFCQGLDFVTTEPQGLSLDLLDTRTSDALEHVVWPRTESLGFVQTPLPSIDELAEQFPHSEGDPFPSSGAADWWDKSFMSLLQ